jgi:uncharacterized Zn finger protein
VAERDYWGFRPYVPVGVRRAQGLAALKQRLRAEKRTPAPVTITGRAIARTFWGRAWCDNLERYSDFASRLPRGRTYARNGSILDLRILPGTVVAQVAGTELYTVEVSIARLVSARWRAVVAACGGRIASAVALLRGELPDDVIAVLTDARKGLFPEPHEIRMQCSCPDAATMCKHVAATLYGVGARLDEQPDLLFTLRQVAQQELVAGAGMAGALGPAKGRTGRKRIAAARVEAIFGIALATEAHVREDARKVRTPRRRGRRNGR